LIAFVDSEFIAVVVGVFADQLTGLADHPFLERQQGVPQLLILLGHGLFVAIIYYGDGRSAAMLLNPGEGTSSLDSRTGATNPHEGQDIRLQYHYVIRVEVRPFNGGQLNGSQPLAGVQLKEARPLGGVYQGSRANTVNETRLLSF